MRQRAVFNIGDRGLRRHKPLGAGDFVLAILVVVLVLFGVIMVFSASYYSSINTNGSPYGYLKSHVMWVVIGGAAMMLTAIIDYHLYWRLAKPLMWISMILLLLLFTPLGITRNNATRWLGMESFPITIMPGEIAKICAILFVAWYLSKHPDHIRSLKDGVLPMLLLAGAYFFLIYKQPNLSTALTVVAIIVGMLFIAGMNIFYLGALAGVGGVGLVMLVLSKGGEHLNRLTSFIDPFKDKMGDGYQVVQSLLALGSGGLFGVGLGRSIQKTLYLPEPQNDFIYSIIGEELGFVGGLLLLSCYIILIWRSYRISIHAPDRFGMLIAAGIATMLSVQVILNIAVVTSSMPPTGITLPFISYGGNALLLLMGSYGILLNISRHIDLPPVKIRRGGRPGRTVERSRL
jgi:cell division protein FtsW